MNKIEAIKIVESVVLVNKPDCALLEDSITEYPGCFSLSYQSKKYIDSGSLSDMLVGHGPVIVCKSTSRVFETGSAHTTERYVQAFEACGDPYGEPSNIVEINGWNYDADKVSATKVVKSASGYGLAQAKAVIDSALSNQNPRFEADSAEIADEAAERLRAYGFNAKQWWSDQS